MKKKKLVKVKLTDKEQAKILAERTDAKLVQQIGRTAVLYKS